jgi:hypothetical protein
VGQHRTYRERQGKSMPNTWYDPEYFSYFDPRTWGGEGGWRTGPKPGYEVGTEARLKPEQSAFGTLVKPVGSALGEMFAENLTGARATRGFLSGRPREVLSVVPGSDEMGLTRPEDRADFGPLGNTLIHPDMAKLVAMGAEGAVNLAKLGLSPARESIEAVPVATQAMAQRAPIDQYEPLVKEAKGLARKAMFPVVTEDFDQLTELPAKNVGGNIAPFVRPTRMYKELPSGEYRGVGGRPVDPVVDRLTRETVANSPLRNKTFGYYQPPSMENLQGYAAIYQQPGPREVNNIPMWSTARHERVHSAIDEAARHPEMISDLPRVLQIPARLRSSPQPITRALGLLADEATAHGLGPRGTYNQVAKASDFLFNEFNPTRSFYSDQASKISPTASTLFGMLPQGARAATTSAKLLPGMVLLDALRRGGGEPVDQYPY